MSALAAHPSVVSLWRYAQMKKWSLWRYQKAARAIRAGHNPTGLPIHRIGIYIVVDLPHSRTDANSDTYVMEVRGTFTA